MYVTMHLLSVLRVILSPGGTVGNVLSGEQAYVPVSELVNGLVNISLLGAVPVE